MTPTEEQLDILTAESTTRDNLMIEALAGTGKSASLKLIDQQNRTKPALYLVFNRRNADEATKSGAFSDTTTIRTFNSIGHRIWAAYCTGSIHLDAKKPQTIFREIVGEMSRDDAQACWDSYFSVMDGVAKAKSLGYIPEGKYPAARRLIDRATLHNSMDETPDELTAGLIDKILLISIQRAYKGTIDYNDQIYMPALFGGTFPKFPLVLVDEYQDQSPVNHAMLERLVRGRIIGVGDPYQNIYGFRGAKADGMSAAVARYSMATLPLSVSFRCPQAIVEAARWRVPHFQWAKPGGHVSTVDKLPIEDFPHDATIICRNNAPLLRLAFRFISVGQSVTVVGSELGPRVVGVMKKLGPDNLDREGVYTAIEEWRAAKLAANSKSANDTADCMRVFAEHGATLSAAIAYAEHLFKQSGSIRLLTGHKSKGLEFPKVYFLDPWLLSDTQQDLNLRYVIQTRSENSLIEIDSKAIV